MDTANPNPPVAAAETAAPPTGTGTAPGSGLGPTGRLVGFAFVVGIMLAIFCLGIAGFYLLRYLAYATGALEAINASHGRPEMLMLHMYMSRVLLQSCGLAVGMAFGFLGFSLFLLGVNGSIDASATSGGGVGLQVARLSPGAFVMLCSAILVGICATRDVPASMGGNRIAAPADNEANPYSSANAAADPGTPDYDAMPADGAANAANGSAAR